MIIVRSPGLKIVRWKKSRRDVRRDAHLASFQHNGTDLSGLCLLFLQGLMQPLLRLIENEGRECSGFWPEYQGVFGKVR